MNTNMKTYLFACILIFFSLSLTGLALASSYQTPTVFTYPTQYPTPYATPYQTPYASPYSTPYASPYATPESYPTPSSYETPYGTPTSYPTPVSYETPYATPSEYATPSYGTPVSGGGGPMCVFDATTVDNCKGSTTTRVEVKIISSPPLTSYATPYVTPYQTPYPTPIPVSDIVTGDDTWNLAVKLGFVAALLGTIIIYLMWGRKKSV